MMYNADKHEKQAKMKAAFYEKAQEERIEETLKQKELKWILVCDMPLRQKEVGGERGDC